MNGPWLEQSVRKTELTSASVTEDGLRILILESTHLILNRIELAESRVLGDARRRDTEPLVYRTLPIPQPLQDTLASIAETRFGGLSGISVVQGVDEVVFHLDRATQFSSRRVAPDCTHAFKVTSIMTAYWFLQITKAADECQSILANPVTSFDEFERQLVQWGMTTKRFLRSLEEV
jgi:hypothetical protein